ncbi:hypothetical protein Cgig2_033179 [Carnegiea gigantea]|uniref:RNase H type-1 domain-containing protein n=1 Tax=Carnegiea gigantea TaxID=171969 RepID=A0A9Q1Q6X8_9CARY|nr:hypothetical protein Cgig2_033179 [Carnegiea gigantea]
MLVETKRSKQEMDVILPERGDFYGIFVAARGYEFTWCNYQLNRVVIKERLDCFCAHADWSLLFPNAWVTHVDFDISDHLHVHLKCSLSVPNHGERKRCIHFENMWFTRSSCHKVALSAWESPSRLDKPEDITDIVTKFLRILFTSAGTLTWSGFVFYNPDKNLGIPSKKAMEFVRSYQEYRVKEMHETGSPPSKSWKPPVDECVKLNFDKRQVGNSCWGCGLVIRNHVGDALLARAKHRYGFAGALVEEACSCLHSLRCAFEYRIWCIVVQEDSLPLIQHLKSCTVNLRQFFPFLLVVF